MLTGIGRGFYVTRKSEGCVLGFRFTSFALAQVIAAQ